MPAVTAEVTELPESRVRVAAEVGADEVERRVLQAARAVGRDMRIPGFRQGKVPPPVIVRRVGREALLDEAVRDALGGWYVEAIDAADVETVGEPKVDLGELPGEGEPLRFQIEVGVRPTAQLGSYQGLQVGRREPRADPELVQRELDALREKAARLESVERPAQTGDFVIIDFVGKLDGEPFPGGEGRDEPVELGSGRLVPGFEDQLVGASAGEARTVEILFPEDYRAEHLAGRHATFDVTVNEVQEKVLPELDDEFAADAAGFDSLDELRADVEGRLRQADESAVEAEYREAVIDAVAAAAQVEVPAELVTARARELWDQTAHGLAHQGIDKDTYLQITGRTEDDIVAEAEPDAATSLRRDAVLAAVVQAEGIDPSEDELLASLEGAAAQQGVKPRKLLERLRSSGGLNGVRRSLALRQAVDRLVASAEPIPQEQAEAREKLWTPEKGGGEGADAPTAGGQIWTPGSS